MQLIDADFTTIGYCCLVSNNSTCSIEFYEKAVELFEETTKFETSLVIAGIYAFVIKGLFYLPLCLWMFDLLHAQ